MSIYVGNKKYAVIRKANLNNTDIRITENGNYTPEGDYTGFGLVRVAVPDPELEPITIEPSIDLQKHISSMYGYSEITVNPVTNEIDENILPENIKKGVTILGVDGELEFITDEITVTPSKVVQEITPEEGTDAFSKITVQAVTQAIDENIKPENIKYNVEILGVKGTVVEVNNTTATFESNGTYICPGEYTGYSEIVVDVTPDLENIIIDPSTTQKEYQSIGHQGYNKVTVAGVTNDIDANINSVNIRDGVTILGITGTLIESNTKPLTITENGTYIPDEPFTGFSKVEVNLDTVNNQEITITESGIYAPDVNHTGFSKVTVDIPKINNTEITIIDGGEYTPNDPYTGFSKVTVDLTWIEEKLKEINGDGLGSGMYSYIDGTATDITTYATSVRDYAFYYLTTLETANLKLAEHIGVNAFTNSGLKTLTIETPKLCTLSTSEVFEGTNIQNIYVPAELVDTYKSATNWSIYANKISQIPVEDDTVIDTSVGGITGDVILPINGGDGSGNTDPIVTNDGNA